MSSGTSLLRPMRARDASQEHRASTPLELFFDLTFVVAVSLAASNLGREIEGQHAARGVGLFALVFFAIWWAWLNFTWFASAYDTDDWLYRLVTLVQMGGALTVAAGIPRAFAGDDFTRPTPPTTSRRCPRRCAGAMATTSCSRRPRRCPPASRWRDGGRRARYVSALAARLSIGLPAAVFVLAVWALLRGRRSSRSARS